MGNNSQEAVCEDRKVTSEYQKRMCEDRNAMDDGVMNHSSNIPSFSKQNIVFGFEEDCVTNACASKCNNSWVEAIECHERRMEIGEINLEARRQREIWDKYIQQVTREWQVIKDGDMSDGNVLEQICQKEKEQKLTLFSREKERKTKRKNIENKLHNEIRSIELENDTGKVREGEVIKRHYVRKSKEKLCDEGFLARDIHEAKVERQRGDQRRIEYFCDEVEADSFVPRRLFLFRVHEFKTGGSNKVVEVGDTSFPPCSTCSDDASEGRIQNARIYKVVGVPLKMVHLPTNKECL